MEENLIRIIIVGGDRAKWILDLLGTTLIIPKERLNSYLELLNCLVKSHPFLIKGIRKIQLFVLLLSLALSSTEDRLPTERSLARASVDNIPQKEG